jgi:hypothetical protein
MFNKLINRQSSPVPAMRGYTILYREDEVNHCPGCGRTHWYIGRLSAECGFCATAIPLAEARVQPASFGHSRNWKPFQPSELAA